MLFFHVTRICDPSIKLLKSKIKKSLVLKCFITSHCSWKTLRKQAGMNSYLRNRWQNQTWWCRSQSQTEWWQCWEWSGSLQAAVSRWPPSKTFHSQEAHPRPSRCRGMLLCRMQETEDWKRGRQKIFFFKCSKTKEEQKWKKNTTLQNKNKN